MILESQKHLFDLSDDDSYFNAAYLTPLTKQQVKIGKQTLDCGGQIGRITPANFFDTTERLRSRLAELVGASAEHIALVPSASYGVSTAANNLKLKPGSVVLTLADQFPSNVYPWLRAAEQAGAVVDAVACPADYDWTAALLARIHVLGERVAVAALPHVHWSNGVMLDLFAIKRALEAVGGKLVLDLTQSMGAVPLNLGALEPAFAVTAAYKWCMGPYATGFLYVHKDYWQGAPLEENWINRSGSEDFGGLANYTADYQPGARRFDMGERANFMLNPVFLEGVEQLLRWGVTNVSETLAQINARIAGLTDSYGFSSVTAVHRSPNILAIQLGAQAGEVLKALQAANIHASVRGHNLRIAPHLWVERRDEEKLGKLLSNFAA